MRQPKAIITGGFGFIGSALCRKLCDLGWETIIFENMEGGQVRQVACLKDDIIEIRNINVVDVDKMEEKFEDVDWFFHFAAHYANEKSLKYPITSISHNVVGTMSSLKFCVSNKIRNFCYASSSGVYGAYSNSNYGEFSYSEDMLPAPNTPYEVGKYSGELLARGWGAIHNMNVLCPRFFNVYGRGDIPGRWRSVVPNFFTHALHGESITVTGARASRDFTYIDDCIEGILAGVTFANDTQSRTDLVYNIANGDEVKIVDLANMIVALTRSKSLVVIGEKRAWDNAERRVGSTDRFNTLFPGLHPRSITRGLEDSKDWYMLTCRNG